MPCTAPWWYTNKGHVGTSHFVPLWGGCPLFRGKISREIYFWCIKTCPLFLLCPLFGVSFIWSVPLPVGGSTVQEICFLLQCNSTVGHPGKNAACGLASEAVRISSVCMQRMWGGIWGCGNGKRKRVVNFKYIMLE